MPVAAWAQSEADGDGLVVHGLVASGDGRVVIRMVAARRPIPTQTGRQLARALLVDGGGSGLDGFEDCQRRRAARGRSMTVYLVGAGPGDPGLLTRRAARLLAGAEVVIHDRLVHPEVLALAPERAQLVDVGKQPGVGPAGVDRQDEINQLLVEHGRRSHPVVRLKGGDPFLFGRGGEEVEVLTRAGIPWEVVPGVTSAFAVPAVVGIPVTHRGLASSVTVVTGRVGDPTAPGRRRLGRLGRPRWHPGRPDGHGRPGRDRPGAGGRRQGPPRRRWR